MTVHKAPEPESEVLRKLSEAKPGDAIRFQGTSFEEALTVDDGGFWLVVEDPESDKKQQVSLLATNFKNYRRADKDRLVHIHPADLQVRRKTK